MKLSLIATPIGNPEDITLRALKLLKSSSIIICEELKTTRRRLSAWGIPPQDKELYQLNEHTTSEELQDLIKVCKTNEVALVTDCGTPSFFDPGFKLVNACRAEHIQVESLPGVSSMTALFPFLKQQTERFDVWGFPPRDNLERSDFFKKIKNSPQPVLILDTPYRLKKTFEDLNKAVPKASCVVGINLTCESERILYGEPKDILAQMTDLNKENFICMVYPN